MHGAVSIFKLIAIGFYLLAYVILWKRRHFYEEEEVVFDKAQMENSKKEEITIHQITKT